MIRTTTVSTSQLRNYKTIVIVLNGFIILIFISLILYNTYFDGQVEGLSGLLSIYVIMNIFTQFVFRLKNVSYDESAVYYNRKGYEVQVPFEDIKSINIETPTGIYSIHLYNPSQNGKEILFKTSVWYPLNFKRQDEKVNDLRRKINKCKRSIAEQNLPELPSFQI